MDWKLSDWQPLTPLVRTLQVVTFIGCMKGQGFLRRRQAVFRQPLMRRVLINYPIPSHFCFTSSQIITDYFGVINCSTWSARFSNITYHQYNKGAVCVQSNGVGRTKLRRTPALHASQTCGSTPPRPLSLISVLTYSDHAFLSLSWGWEAVSLWQIGYKTWYTVRVHTISTATGSQHVIQIAESSLHIKLGVFDIHLVCRRWAETRC